MNKFTLVSAMACVGAIAMATPDNPENFKMVFDFNGGNPIVTGSFDCPTEHYTWETPKPQIQKITKVKVIRGSYDAGESDIVAYESDEEREPGSHVEFTDEFGELQYGCTYNYNARIYDEEGAESYGASFSLFYGIQPEQPTISVSLGEKGALPVNITIVASDKTKQGDLLTVPLTQLRVIEYIGYENEREVAIVNDPVPGKSYAVTDTEATEGKSYSYRVYAICEYGTSEYGWASAYVGMDAPGKPTDLAMTENEDGSITLNWTAPEIGKNGGYVDPESIRYKVIRHGDEEADLAEDLTECTYTDPLEGLTGPTAVKYEVVSYNTVGDGDYAMSVEVLKGPAYQLPFEENFDKIDNSGWWASFDSNKKWTYESNGYSSNWDITDYAWSLGINGVGDGNGAESRDDDAYIRTYYSSRGDVDTMVSAAIDFKEASYPVLSFYFAADKNDPTTLTVGTRVAGESEDLVTFVPSESQDPEQSDAQWIYYMLPIDNVAGEEAAIFFTAAVPEDAEDNSDIALDRIIICDYPCVKSIDVKETDNGLEVSWDAPQTSYGDEPLSYDVVLDDAEPVNVTDTKYVIEATRADEEAPAHKVSIRANYKEVSGKFSPAFDAVAGGSESGIVVIGSESDSSVEYYDLNGLRLVRAMNGSTVIRRTIKADGSVKVEKVIVRK